MRRRPRPIRRGFTLIELMATATVLAALGSTVSFIMMTSVDSYSRASTRLQLNSEVSIALDRIDQLLRYIPRTTSGPNISSLTATSLTWQSNWSLSLSGSQLMLTENGGSARVLLTDVTALSITAYTESNTALSASLSGSACDPIRRIQIEITVQRSGVSETLRSRVFIRSLMSGIGS